MSRTPQVLLASLDHGRWPVASTMNPAIEADRPLLRAVLDVRWEEPDPPGALRRIQASLLSFAPEFGRHQCRGPAAYHAFAADPPAAGGSTGPAGPRSFDPCLALAHLIEHAIIEFQCDITGARRCSGVTGARHRPPGRFDILVECDDFAVGRFCLAFAIALLSGAADAHPPGPVESAALAAARQALLRPDRSLSPAALAGNDRWPAATAARALRVLAQFGLLAEERFPLNFSGVPSYRLVGS